MTRWLLRQADFPLPATDERRYNRVSARIRLGVAVAGALALLALAAPAAAAMYKWVDANGRVVYSDQPPPANVKSEILRPPPPPANPNAARELADQEIANQQRDKKRAEEAKAAETARQASERKREACVNALGHLRALQQRDETLYRYNEKGERVIFDDGMRREEFERQQRIVRENCPG